jgi:glycosyltransferase involved in cell wall biosynthesis
MFVGRPDPAKGQAKGLLAFACDLVDHPHSILWFFSQFSTDDPEGLSEYLQLKLLVEDRPEKRKKLEKDLKEALTWRGKESSFSEISQLLEDTHKMLSSTLPDGVLLRKRVQFFTNLSTLIGDFSYFANAHLILSSKEGYNLVINEQALHGLSVIVNDLPAFKDRIIDGKQGGWIVRGDPKVFEMDGITYLQSFISRDSIVCDYIANIRKCMRCASKNKELAAELAERLVIWVKQNGHILQYHGDRLAVILAPLKEIEKYDSARHLSEGLLKSSWKVPVQKVLE